MHWVIKIINKLTYEGADKFRNNNKKNEKILRYIMGYKALIKRQYLPKSSVKYNIPDCGITSLRKEVT